MHDYQMSNCGLCLQIQPSIGYLVSFFLCTWKASYRETRQEERRGKERRGEIMNEWEWIFCPLVYFPNIHNGQDGVPGLGLVLELRTQSGFPTRGAGTHLLEPAASQGLQYQKLEPGAGIRNQCLIWDTGVPTGSLIAMQNACPKLKHS